MRVIVDERVKKFLEKLDKQSYSKAYGYIRLFEKYAYDLPTNYLKKVKQDIWELRPGKLRLFLYVKSDLAVTVHATIKKSQKIRQQDIEIITQRVKDYEKAEEN